MNNIYVRTLYELYDFYGILGGFLAAQELTFFIATQASQHSTFGHVVIRLIYYMVAVLMLVIFDNKLHWFQVKNILLMQTNGTLLMMKIGFHPVSSLLLLSLISYPLCKRFEKEYAEHITEAFKDDEKMYFACGKQRPVK